MFHGLFAGVVEQRYCHDDLFDLIVAGYDLRFDVEASDAALEQVFAQSFGEGMVKRHSAGVRPVFAVPEENALVAPAGQPLCYIVALLGDEAFNVQKVAANCVLCTPAFLILSCVSDFIDGLPNESANLLRAEKVCARYLAAERYPIILDLHFHRISGLRVVFDVSVEEVLRNIVRLSVDYRPSECRRKLR